MSQPLKVSLPPGVSLWDGCVVRVTAIDPVTGDTVSGVNVQNVTLQVIQTAGSEQDLTVGNWQLVPGPGA